MNLWYVERGQSDIGPRFEFKMVALTYADLFHGVPANQAALAEVMLETFGETLVLRFERLHRQLEDTLFACGEEA
jgi:hypothetical protein